MSSNNNDTGRSNSFGVKAFVKLQLVRTPAVSMAAGFMKLNYSSRVLKINCRFSTLQSRTSSCRHWLHQWEPQMLQQQCFRPIRSHYSKFAGNWKNGNLLCVMNMDSWCPQLRQSSLLQRKSCAWIQDFPLWSWLQRCLFLQSKSPHGRLRARVVICGNHLTKVNEESNNSAGETQPKDSNPFSLYAGGADGTTLRCLMKCAAENSWSVGTVDVKTAFLLAPRPDEQERLLVARPPKVLIEAGICDASELWEISHAVYGLNDAPANWSQYRDRELPQLRFSAGGHDYQLVSTPEPNLWKLIKTDPGALL